MSNKLTLHSIRENSQSYVDTVRRLLMILVQLLWMVESYGAG